MEYICFLHPRVIGNSPTDPCPECGNAFDFPSINPPERIDNYLVRQTLGRGFYSVAYLVEDSATGITFVLKATPAAVYEPPDALNLTKGGYGDRRDFLEECHLHRDVRDIPQVAALNTWRENQDVDFGGVAVRIHCAVMELVLGESLAGSLQSPASPHEIAQIADDLLEFVERMAEKGVHHNDLHGGNAAVTHLSRESYRRRAIAPGIAVKVFDLGSASRQRREDEGHLSDIENICELILRLTAQTSAAQDADARQQGVRLVAQLRKVAMYYKRGDWDTRIPTPSSMREAISSAVRAASESSTRREYSLSAIDSYYNAQQMPPEFAGELLYEPEGEWTRELVGPGPQLVIGMRGCGKTHLLRSLEWAGRALEHGNDSLEQVRERIQHESYIGLFVSCGYLLRSARELVGTDAVPRLILCFAREAVRAASLCETLGHGEVDFQVLGELLDFLHQVLPEMEEPPDGQSLAAAEVALNRAILKDIKDAERIPPLESFTQLTRIITRLVDIWRNKTVLYLLDDLSLRYVQGNDLHDLLRQLCLKSELFGFKISTETQTQIMYLPSGVAATEGRDYQVFNLGAQVLDQLSKSGFTFVEEVLSRRHRLIAELAYRLPHEVLGDIKLEDIARQIKTLGVAAGQVRKQAYPYYGISALSAICVGDIGDVVRLYRLMLQEMIEGVVPADAQTRTLMGESESRTLALVSKGSELFQHASAFARASQWELLHSKRLRQYADVRVEFETGDESAFEKIIELANAGVYVVTGLDQRSRDGVTTSNQISLRFRKILGLLSGIPLGNRDRFELPAARLRPWLDNPRMEHLTGSASSEDADAPEFVEFMGTEAQAASDLDSGPGSDRGQPSLLDEPAEAPELSHARAAMNQEARTVHNAVCAPVPITPDCLPWEDTTLITAAGFEDRALAIWAELQRLERGVRAAVVLEYENPGNAESILAKSENHAQSSTFVNVDSRDAPGERLAEVLKAVETVSVVVDVSALTKPWIYALVEALLRAGLDVHIFHSAAAEYEPQQDDLAPVLSLLQEGRYTDALRGLEPLTAGEGRDFSVIEVGRAPTESGVRRVLVTFVTLKHERLRLILEHEEYDRLIGIRTIHTRGEHSIQSQILDRVARYLIGTANGAVQSLKAMDADGTYQLLSRTYRTMCLEDVYSLRLALTGTKMQTVGCGMFAAVVGPLAAVYAAASEREPDRFTHRIGETTLWRLRMNDA